MQNKNGVTIDRYVIMPDHIHAVVFIAVETVERDGRKNGGAGDRGRSPLQGVVRNVKSFVTKWAGFSPWQKSFYDHIIRNEIEYVQIIKYIEDNPAKWIAGETEDAIQWIQ
jgi:REP element-mobilizing transposase RayT